MHFFPGRNALIVYVFLLLYRMDMSCFIIKDTTSFLPSNCRHRPQNKHPVQNNHHFESATPKTWRYFRNEPTTKVKQDTRHILIMTDVKWHQKLIVGRDNLCVEDDQPVNHIASPENHVWGYRENDNILGYPSFICRPLFGFFHIWSQKIIQVVLDFRKHLDHHFWVNKLS